MIKVEGIKKTFNKNSRSANTVLKGVSFELPDKGLVAIFGKSGSGKTTLLNIMGGLEKADEGKIYIDNIDTTGKVDFLRNSKIGFIFQNYYLEAGYTIEEIMRNAMIIAGFKDENLISERTMEVLKLVKMDRYKHKTADSLSGGQKQRVAIARALIKGSNVILADEPTGNLDSENTMIVMDILKEISKTQLVVLVTHEVNLIYKYADSHIKLVDGELKEDGELDKEIEVEVEKNNIYVNKEEKRTINIDKANLNIYGENVNESNIDIFSNNGEVYIKPGRGVKVITEKSEKKVIFDEEPKEKIEINEVPKYEISNSKTNGKLFNLHNVWKGRNSKDSEKASSTGNIFNQLFIVIFAIVLCFFSFFIFEGMNRKIENKQIDDKTVYLDMKSYQEIRNFDKSIYDNIDFFELNYDMGSFSFANQDSRTIIKTLYAPKALKLDATKEEAKLIFGEMPKNNEILITRKLASDIKHGLRYDEYQNDASMLLIMFNKKYRVSGIVEGNEPFLYMNKVDYVNFLGIYSEIMFTDSTNKFFEPKFINKDTGATINSYSAEICLYDGTTLDLLNNQAVIEINRSSTYLMMNDSKDADYKVDKVNRLLLTQPQHISILNSYPMYIREFNLNRDEMNTDIKIYVNKEAMENIFTYIAPNLDILNKDSNYFFEITTKDDNQFNLLKAKLTERSIFEVDVNYLYEAQNKEIVKSDISNLMIFIIISVLLFIIYYFIEKSNSLKNSKEYGIFRAIGINKSNLLYKETITTIKTRIITYLISYIVMFILISVRYYMMNINVWEFSLISALMMVSGGTLMILISLIPYLFVLYKTPSEILSSYDI